MGPYYQLCNATANITTLCSSWMDITNATSTRYTTPTGDSNLNHTMIRFQLFNTKGTFTSSPVEILVTGSAASSPSPPSYHSLLFFEYVDAVVVVTGNTTTTTTGGDGVNVGAIVGPIVGGLALICCLFLLCLSIIIILLILRKRATG